MPVQYGYGANNQLTQWGSSSPTYDADGDMTSDGASTYTWNARGQLVGISGAVSASFEYDALGRRVEKTTNGATTAYLYDGVNPVQLTSEGTVSANLLTGLGVDEYLQWAAPSGTADFLTDALGSTVALTGPTGAIVDQYTYGPYGAASQRGASQNPFQFTGRENDGAALYYYRARYYNPAMGRFLNEDPLAFEGGDVNLYAYVANDPIDLSDPFGLTWQSNWNYFWNWALGRGPRFRYYGQNDIETKELMNSPGINKLRNAFYRGGCQSQSHLSYGTVEAYWDTTVNPSSADWSNTAAEVGGFGGASIINNGNGTATYTIPNTSGTHSFFLHLVPNRQSPTVPMSNIYQMFQWTEPLLGQNCGCQH